LYAAGPGGLFSDAAQFRVGELLPPAPLTCLSPAITGWTGKPELWMGTRGEGVIGFDGRRFRHVRPNGADFRNITSILGLKTGHVVLGTEKAGVLIFDGSQLSVFHDGLKGMHVTALAGDETDLWVGTTDRGLLHWRAGQVTAVGPLSDKHVLSIAVGSEGTVYAGTALGISAIRGDRVERSFGEGLFAQTLFARGRQLYVGTLDAGIYEVGEPGARPRYLEIAGAAHRILEAGGELLAVTDEGVMRAREGTPVLAPAGALLSDRNISALSVDPSGQLWVGYFDRGLDIVDAGLSRVRHLEDQHLFCVNRILHGKGTAVATANGLVLFDASGQQRQVLGREQGLIANHVTDVAMNGEEMIVATPAGLSFIGADGIRSLYAFHGLVNNHTYAIGAVNGRVLAGTLGGLSILETGTVRANYTTSNSPLRQNWITAIADSGTDAFIGTYGAGVVKLGADGSWQTFADMPKGTEINPGALLSAGGTVYAGTLGKGLLVYRPSENRWHTVTQGLPSLNVTAVHVSNKRVFVGTDNGLVRLP
jgi:ligand-binding sensor domain-containing protein